MYPPLDPILLDARYLMFESQQLHMKILCVARLHCVSLKTGDNCALVVRELCLGPEACWFKSKSRQVTTERPLNKKPDL